MDIIVNIITIDENFTSKFILSFFDAGKVPNKIILKCLHILNDHFGEKIHTQAKELLPKFLSTCSMVK